LAQYLQERNWDIPPGAVGDLAFNLLDKDGRSIELATPDARQFLRQFNPILDLSTLQHIAAANRVLLVLASDEPEQKKQIATTVLKRGYATDVVLGVRLARAILSE